MNERSTQIFMYNEEKYLIIDLKKKTDLTPYIYQKDKIISMLNTIKIQKI